MFLHGKIGLPIDDFSLAIEKSNYLSRLISIIFFWQSIVKLYAHQLLQHAILRTKKISAF